MGTNRLLVLVEIRILCHLICFFGNSCTWSCQQVSVNHNYEKLVVPLRWIFFSRVPTPWISTSNINIPTVTSQIPHFLELYLNTMYGYFGYARWNRGWIFLHNIKAFLDGILLIFHAQEIFKSTTYNPDLHPMNLTMIYWYPPLMARFSLQWRFSNRQKWRVM